MDITSEIFVKVYQYLNREIGLEELEDWIVPRSVLLLGLPHCTAYELAGEIDLGLAEMSSGQRTEDEFRALLREFVKSCDFILMCPSTYPFEYPGNQTGSTMAVQIGEAISI